MDKLPENATLQDVIKAVNILIGQQIEVKMEPIPMIDADLLFQNLFKYEENL